MSSGRLPTQSSGSVQFPSTSTGSCPVRQAASLKPNVVPLSAQRYPYFPSLPFLFSNIVICCTRFSIRRLSPAHWTVSAQRRNPHSALLLISRCLACLRHFIYLPNLPTSPHTSFLKLCLFHCLARLVLSCVFPIQKKRKLELVLLCRTVLSTSTTICKKNRPFWILALCLTIPRISPSLLSLHLLHSETRNILYCCATRLSVRIVTLINFIKCLT